MDFANSILIVGIVSLLICVPSMNVVVTAGNMETLKSLNGSCSDTPVCQGGIQTVEPESLDFGPVIIGQVIVKNIRIHTYNRSFEVTKVAAPESCIHLYTQLKPKTVKNDHIIFKIRVALVPKVIGALDGLITVFTNLGLLQIPVHAQIGPSPFRISPIEHPRVPLGSSFSADISVYNPFSSPLRVIQLYLSGGPFHLTVPENVELSVNRHLAPADKEKWDIPGFSSRAVATVIVDTSRGFREKSYIRMKFNNTVFDEVMIPIDVAVFEGCGLFSVDGVINFGFVRASSGLITVPLRLRLSKPCLTRHIEEIYDTSEVPLVMTTIVQRSVSDSAGSTVVAELKFNANLSKPGLVEGEILVKNGLERLVIPYRAYIAEGAVTVPHGNHTLFMETGSSGSSLEVIKIRNDYAVPLVVFDAAVTGDKMCSDSEVAETQFPVIIPPSGSATVATVRTRVTTRIPHTVTVSLKTNIEPGNVDFPLHLFTGELKMDTSQISDWLLHGMLFGCNDTAAVTFRNINPTTVRILDVDITSDCLDVGNVSVCQSENCSTPMEFQSFNLDSGSIMNVSLVCSGLKREVKCQSTLRVTTNFQVFVTQLPIAVLPGRLDLYEYPIVMEDIYPTRYVQRNITIFNTFERAIDIHNIYSEEFSLLRMDPPLEGVEIGAEMGLVFDTLTFDARELCKDLPGLCYVGFDLESVNERSEAWKRPFRMVTHSSVEIDRRMKEKQLATWNSLSDGNDFFEIDTSVAVTTKQNYVFHLPIILSFVYPPPLITTDVDMLEFPLLSVGNYSEMDVEISNPSDQILFVHAYVFRDDKAISWNRDIFYVKSIVPKGTTQGFYDVDDERLPDRVRMPTPSRGTAATIMPSGGQLLVRLVFQPQSEACYTAMFHLRNNLTVVESIPVRGCGVEPNIRFSNEGTVPPIPSLTMKFTGKDAVYCRNRTVDTADRSKIKRTGRVTITNTVGAFVNVESVSIAEDEWYHRSFALTKPVSPFLLAPNKTKRLSVEFNADFGVAKKVGRLLVFVSDRTEPFIFEITGEVDPGAMFLCRPCFGRSSNDLWIRYVLFSKRFGWVLFLLPALFLGGYISFIRNWYTKRLKSQFLQRYATLLEQKPGMDRFNHKSADSSQNNENDTRRRTARRKGNGRAGASGEAKETEELPNLIHNTDSNMSLRDSLERQIPEALRELFGLAYLTGSPYTFLRNHHFPSGLLNRLFLLAEFVVFPVCFTLDLVKCWLSSVLKKCGLRRFAQESNPNDFFITLNAVGSSGCREVVTSFPREPLVDWKKVFNFIPAYGKTEATAEVRENGSAGHLSNGVAGSASSRSSILSKENQSNKTSSSGPPVATVAPLKRHSVTPKPTPAPLVSVKADDPDPPSRDSSSGDNEIDESGGSDEPDLDGRQSAMDDESKSSRKLRRRQMHQMKLVEQRTAKNQKTYNKTQRKAEEKKALEAQVGRILADDKTSPEPSSDSEADRRHRIEVAKRKAKVDAEKLIRRTTKPVSPVEKVNDTGHRNVDRNVDLSLSNRPYPVQTDVIQQAFFKVEPRENGLMFTEITREESFQLVKQLKRDRPNLFQLDPKASIDLLQQVIRTTRYRLNGDYVDLAMKSTVAGYTGSDRSRKEMNGFTEPGSHDRYSTRSQMLSHQAQRASDQRSPENGWSFSPTGSENGSRLSPMMSYADVAGQQSANRKSVDLTPRHTPDSSDSWKTYSPNAVPLSQKKSSEGSRFLWDEPTLTGPTFSAPPDMDDAALLRAYQSRQRDLVEEASGRLRRSNNQSLFFRSESRELENYLADLEKKSRDELLNTEVESPSTWPSSFLSSASNSHNIWKDTGLQSSWPSSNDSESRADSAGWPVESSSNESQSQSTYWPNSIWSTSSFFTSETPQEESRDSGNQLFGAIGESITKPKRLVDGF